MNTYNIYEKKELLHQLNSDYFYIDEDGVAYFYNYINEGIEIDDDDNDDVELEVELVHTVPHGNQYIITKVNK